MNEWTGWKDVVRFFVTAVIIMGGMTYAKHRAEQSVTQRMTQVFQNELTTIVGDTQRAFSWNPTKRHTQVKCKIYFDRETAQISISDVVIFIRCGTQPLYCYVCQED